MKLIRFGAPGAEKPGLILGDGTRVDASAFGSDWDERCLGSDGPARLAAWARDHAAKAPRVPEGERLGPCVARPSKIVCIGLNYADHARETGKALPKEPLFWFKAPTSLIADGGKIEIPFSHHRTDYEAELAIVIGRRVRRGPASSSATAPAWTPRPSARTGTSASSARTASPASRRGPATT